MTAASAPKAREGLRRGIVVLGIPALGVITGIALVAKQIEQRRNRTLAD